MSSTWCSSSIALRSLFTRRLSDSLCGSSLQDWRMRLGELGHEGNHEIEKTNGLDEGETQNGVREELATESRVAGDGVEEGGEDETDTDTSTGQTDGGGTHTQVLGDLDHGLGDLRRVGAAGLESLAGGGVDDLAGLLALDGLESVAGHGALGGSNGGLSSHGRSGDLGAHGGGEAGSSNTDGGHCDGFGLRGDVVVRCGKDG
jgi:hypothetical protein